MKILRVKVSVKSLNIKTLNVKAMVVGGNVNGVVVHSRGAPTDRIDEVVDFWRRENPDVDVTTKCLTMRLRRAAHLVERAMRRELAKLGLEQWEVDMLLALRRADGRSSAGTLMRQAQITSGAITNRLGRLEGHGWIRRDVDPADRRQVLVSLTADGAKRADEVIAAKNDAEQRLYGDVPRATIERLNRDLRTLLAAVELEQPS